MTKAAPALKSEEYTGAPDNLLTPSKKAVLPWAVIFAPILFSSSVYWNLESQILSLIVLVPLASDKTTPICGCKSVGKPG